MLFCFLCRAKDDQLKPTKTRWSIVRGSIWNLYKYNIILYNIKYKTATSSIPFTLFWLAPIGLCGYKRDYISLQGRRGSGTIQYNIRSGRPRTVAAKQSTPFVLNGSIRNSVYYYNNAVRSYGIYWSKLTVILLLLLYIIRVLM